MSEGAGSAVDSSAAAAAAADENTPVTDIAAKTTESMEIDEGQAAAIKNWAKPLPWETEGAEETATAEAKADDQSEETADAVEEANEEQNVEEENTNEEVEDSRPETPVAAPSANSGGGGGGGGGGGEPSKPIADASSAAKGASVEKMTQFPVARVKHIMKLDPDVTMASPDAVFLVAKATEMFVEIFSRECYAYTSAAKKKTVSKQDVDKAIDNIECLAFLDGAIED